MLTYTVQAGDSPSVIAKKFTGNAGRAWELIAANRWKNLIVVNSTPTFASLSVGEQLRVPIGWRANVTGVTTNLSPQLSSSLSNTQCIQDTDCTDPSNPVCNIIAGTCGPKATCSGATNLTDQAIMSSGTNCGVAFAQNAQNAAEAGKLWASAISGMSQGLATGIEVAGAIVVVEALLAQVGLAVVDTLVNTAILWVATEVGISIGAATATGAAGGSVLGPIGAVIGAVIGVIVGVLSAVLYTCDIKVTNGTSTHCSDYPGKVQAAADWLNNNSDKLTGVTPKQLADQFSIFLANPVWLFVNQQVLGFTQPSPPNMTSDSGQLYYDLPGAFELLNKAQLIVASQLVTSSPGKIPFWKSMAIPGNPLPSQNVGDYSPGSGTANSTSWGFGTYSSLTNSYTYTAAPNMMAGTSPNPAYNTKSKAGLYQLQILFPALTKYQCDVLFNHPNVQNAHANTLLSAKTFAMTQTTDPTLSIATGSQYNLEKEDMEPIIADWQAMNPGVATISLASPNKSVSLATAATTIAVGSAVGSGLLWLYASQHGMTFAQGARSVAGIASRDVKGAYGTVARKVSSAYRRLRGKR